MSTLLWLAAPAAPAFCQAASRPPTFAAGVEMVKLSVSVTDPHNSYVTGLEQGDFAVFEDGVPQQLTLFAHKDLPLSLAFMIDGSSSMEEKRRSAQEAALRLARTLRPEDEAEVVEFTGRSTVLQPFTHDEAAVEAAIRRTEANGTTALHTAVYITLKDLERQERSGELRRRAIVLFTDGEDTASAVTDDQVIELARKSDVTIYSILLQSRRPEDRSGEAFVRAQYVMSALGRETGGRAYFPTAVSELGSVYDRIGQELRTLYGVGYAPSNITRDGKWRRIVVRVRTRDGLTVHHRIGYFAPHG